MSTPNKENSQNSNISPPIKRKHDSICNFLSPITPARLEGAQILAVYNIENYLYRIFPK